ncbi:unnamed protein product [Victoria cruziana]
MELRFRDSASSSLQ